MVPEVYRTAMVSVLESVPPQEELAKAVSKSRRSSHGSAAPAAETAQAIPGTEASAGEAQVTTTAAVAQAGEESAQVAPAVASSAPEAPAKKHEGKSSKQSKAKAAAKEREKVQLPAPGEDRVTLEAKARALHALEAHPGFASREDATAWLQDTLEGDPAARNLTTAYEQEVNAQLPGDADKLMDQTASIRSELARSEYRLVPEKWGGVEPTERELPGLLVSIALLSLGAPLCFNLLKSASSLRPLSRLK